MVEQYTDAELATIAANINRETVQLQQEEIRRLERIERVAQEIAAWGRSVPLEVIERLKATLGGHKLLPYPFCRHPEKCAGMGRCQAEFCCND